MDNASRHSKLIDYRINILNRQDNRLLRFRTFFILHSKGQGIIFVINVGVINNITFGSIIVTKIPRKFKSVFLSRICSLRTKLKPLAFLHFFRNINYPNYRRQIPNFNCFRLGNRSTIIIDHYKLECILSIVFIHM